MPVTWCVSGKQANGGVNAGLKYDFQFVEEFCVYDPFMIWEAMKAFLSRGVKFNSKKAPWVAD